jgi:hypothetical protein
LNGYRSFITADDAWGSKRIVIGDWTFALAGVARSD